MTGLLVTLKAAEHVQQDIQEDKEPLFDAADTLSGALQIAAGVL